jgi:hypothetical protein
MRRASCVKNIKKNQKKWAYVLFFLIYIKLIPLFSVITYYTIIMVNIPDNVMQSKLSILETYIPFDNKLKRPALIRTKGYHPPCSTRNELKQYVNELTFPSIIHIHNDNWFIVCPEFRYKLMQTFISNGIHTMMSDVYSGVIYTQPLCWYEICDLLNIGLCKPDNDESYTPEPKKYILFQIKMRCDAL